MGVNYCTKCGKSKQFLDGGCVCENELAELTQPEVLALLNKLSAMEQRLNSQGDTIGKFNNHLQESKSLDETTAIIVLEKLRMMNNRIGELESQLCGAKKKRMDGLENSIGYLDKRDKELYERVKVLEDRQIKQKNEKGGGMKKCECDELAIMMDEARPCRHCLNMTKKETEKWNRSLAKKNSKYQKKR